MNGPKEGRHWKEFNISPSILRLNLLLDLYVVVSQIWENLINCLDHSGKTRHILLSRALEFAALLHNGEIFPSSKKNMLVNNHHLLFISRPLLFQTAD